MSLATDELRRVLGKRNIHLTETLGGLPSVLAEQFGDPQRLAQVVAWKPLPNGIVVGEAISLQLASDLDHHEVIADVIEQDLRRAAGVESANGTQARNGASGRSRSEARAAEAARASGAGAQARTRPGVTAQLAAPAIGYRAFRWDGTGPLRSTGIDASWPITREPQRAKCLAAGMGAHDAPQEDCTCGIYAHSTPDSVPAGVGGVVMGYGNLIVHPDGWRAETAELVALVVRPGANRARLYAAEEPTREGVQMIAEQYGVRALDRWEDAAALARELGAEPVPEILHAEAEAWLLGPEKHEPLFPEMFGLSSPMGIELERRLRLLCPWIRREFIMQMECHQDPYGFHGFGGLNRVGSAQFYSILTKVSLRILEPQHRAEVEVTLHI